MSSNDDTVQMEAITEKTAEVGMTIDTILKSKAEIIEHLTGGSVDKKLLIKELLITSYITGFFAGTSSAHRDIEKTVSN